MGGVFILCFVREGIIIFSLFCVLLGRGSFVFCRGGGGGGGSLFCVLLGRGFSVFCFLYGGKGGGVFILFC